MRLLIELFAAFFRPWAAPLPSIWPRTSQCVNPRRLEAGSYGLVGKPVTMGVRRADGTLKSQDAETEADERWLSQGPGADDRWWGPNGR